MKSFKYSKYFPSSTTSSTPLLSTTVIVVYIFLTINLSRCDVANPSAGNATQAPADQRLDNKNNLTLTNGNLNKNNSHISSQSETKHIDKLINSSTLKDKSTLVTANQTNDVGLPSGHVPTLDSGAMMRAFYVFLGLSVIGVAYLVFRSTRLRKSPAQMVRKYGILANKQDIEMRPLPLDEEDDDDNVVFDASGLTRDLNQAT
ncbi:uncharacterized protein LOC103570823 [Microplitis demolitor]|uniref:uncharacterized protein LOC103570823 n=1 Tax=Microplitis demolitor TaxID=69319 RepID=UPI0004CD14CC|nr:uncharacterized protein LOC103570823 [Microplitis demolitor]